MKRSVKGTFGRLGPFLLVGALAAACDPGSSGGSGGGDQDAEGGGENTPDGSDSTGSVIDGAVRDATPRPDARVPPPDAERLPPDARVTPPDAETLPPDAAKPPPDDGVTPPDAEAPCLPDEVRPCPDDGACPGSTQACVEGAWAACEAPAELCDGEDNDCDGTTDDGFELGVECFAGTGGCERVGVTVCAADQQRAICGAAPGLPGVEACNGVDDDCDGVADGDPEGALTQNCYDGSAASMGIGVCRPGLSVCLGGTQGECAGQILPTPEVCNGLDDDCDGQTDEAEDGAPLQETCYGGPAGTEANGLCRPGVHVCGLGGVFGPCEGEVVPAFEICDQADNDCNGQSDDVNGGCACSPGETQACYSGPAGTEDVGLCASGTQTCLPDGTTFGPCVGQVLPGNERCDGLDNDCSGLVDDAVAGTGVACDEGAGACRASGETICDPEVGEIFCSANPGEPGVEICDALDNDCDGVIDDGLPVDQPCTVGLGACTSTGAYTCGEGGEVVCAALVVEPSDEVCDGVDNDCNGTTDDDFRVGEACTDGEGACAAEGVFACDAEGGVACTGVGGVPTDEVCDGVDNDCNGVVDDGNPGGGEACPIDLAGNCGAGLTACRDGAVICACVQQVVPRPETCDGQDDDCNGTRTTAPTACVLSRPATTARPARRPWVCVRAASPVQQRGVRRLRGAGPARRDEICDTGTTTATARGRRGRRRSCACRPGEVRRACYTGPAGTQGVGLCARGTQICADDGLSFGPCNGRDRARPASCATAWTTTATAATTTPSPGSAARATPASATATPAA
jgi:hypothetical protein